LQESPGDEHPLAPGFAILDRRSERLAPIRDELQALEKAGRLSPPLSDLVSSYIHMFTNRMLRSQGRAHEMVLYDFLHRINQSRAARKK
ncbi:MAG: lantibiotic dehydratase C-terminal domain-containing protein, partial [Acidobacteriota bacterium]